MPKLSDKQREIVELRDCNILVSAAAGSGKTRVLVERIIGRIMDEKDPVDIDRILVLTFTTAAAGEMRARIAEAINGLIEQNPDNERLKKQASLIYNAQITTIDSFCMNILRNNFTEIGLEPGFRVADTKEVMELADEALDEVLEEILSKETTENGHRIEYLEDFLGRFENKDNLKKIRGSILSVYDEADKAPFIEEYIEQRRQDYAAADMTVIAQTEWFRATLAEIDDKIAGALLKLQEFRRLCEEGPIEYSRICDEDEEIIRRLSDYGDYYGLTELAKQGVKWPQLPGKTSCDQEEKKKAQDVRNLYKDLINGVLAPGKIPDEAMLVKCMESNNRVINALLDIVMLYHERFTNKKTEKGILTFSDIEHLALRIMLSKQEDRYVPTQVALDYRKAYRELMIDEYQDSNKTQELLIHSISGEDDGIYDRFMVGDVKQSIYRFRNADPRLFMEKYSEYSPRGDKLRRVDLSANYRSRRQVLDTVNAVFEKIMDREWGGVDYDELNRLNYGETYDELPSDDTDYSSELMLLVNDKDDTVSKPEKEARMLAARIKRLLKEQMIFDKSTKQRRLCRYRDIVILMRTIPANMDEIRRVFESEGIPVHTPSKSGYFNTTEIVTILNYLKTIDNPYNEIELYGSLLSVFGGFDENETVLLKKVGGSLYEGLKLFASTEELNNHPKVTELIQKGITGEEIDKAANKASVFMRNLTDIRAMVPYTPVYKLIRYIYDKYDYIEHVSALPAGLQRKVNASALLNKAEGFCRDGFKGIFDFCRYIERLHKYESDEGEVMTLSENEDVVRIMTMHKSKGLEFPVCILASMNKEFNFTDSKNDIIFHDEYGIGLDYIDPVRRIKVRDLRKRHISGLITKDTISEEMRVLYVAMTRAEQKLLMSAVISDKELEAVNNSDTITAVKERKSIKSNYDILMMTRGNDDWNGQCSVHVYNPEDIASSEYNSLGNEGIRRESFKRKMTEVSQQDVEITNRLRNKIIFKYPHKELDNLYTKTSVSELKMASIHDGILKGEEYDIPNEFFRTEVSDTYIPAFAKENEESISGAAVGSAVHRVMELIDYTYEREFDESLLNEQIGRAVKRNAIKQSDYELVDKRKVVEFVTSDIGKRMSKAAAMGKLYKEKPFVLGISADRLGNGFPDSETVLIQGIIDVFFIEDDHIVLLDYKTDSVKSEEELIKRYKTQLDYYEEALCRILDKEVTERLLYSFALRKTIKC